MRKANIGKKQRIHINMIIMEEKHNKIKIKVNNDITII